MQYSVRTNLVLLSHEEDHINIQHEQLFHVFVNCLLRPPFSMLVVVKCYNPANGKCEPVITMISDASSKLSYILLMAQFVPIETISDA
jgi:hypothetical protein